MTPAISNISKPYCSDVKPEKQDVVVVVVHHIGFLGSGEFRLTADQICGRREIELFSKVVTVAEKAGKHVELLTMPGKDEASALIGAASQLGSSRIVTHLSPNLSMDEHARLVGLAWEQLPSPRPALVLEIFPENEPPIFYSLGPHQPRLWPNDIDLVHRLWTELADRPGVGGRLHHRDIVGLAVRRLDEQLHSGRYGEVVADLGRELNRERGQPPPPTTDSTEPVPDQHDDGAGLA